MGIMSLYHDICLGNVFGSGHPIHPITVHYPLTTLMAAYGIDMTVHSRPYLPRLLTSLLPSTPVLAQVAYYSNAAGLIFMAPALITGFHEFYEIYKHLGTKRVEDGVVLQSYPQRTFNVAAIHGVLNALTGAYSLYLWRARKNVPGHMSTPRQGLASGLVLGSLIFSAALGGKLVYDYGIGVQRQGSAIEDKKAMWKDLSRHAE
ncbi:hypothetical protein FFLO_05886 [Filobasidium floriforme]|uniref:DUF2231 domain-containing protein n=1 Tax=Filobasidium floriforme TaxID=5210 RepID=A0A8K0JLL2_9TREE|nr:uncharacterized protein HD553DRAFT_200140 [Filobasidium floriforme]KAG7528929.1 hypothetical protein FFLO_05886 [Filobasidium floriforme]KAH8087490.1 hypothetical protein HD553DRAFT_200140 [Filobasidium floriforme]